MYWLFIIFLCVYAIIVILIILLSFHWMNTKMKPKISDIEIAKHISINGCSRISCTGSEYKINNTQCPLFQGKYDCLGGRSKQQATLFIRDNKDVL